jgi:hypothetical protein
MNVLWVVAIALMMEAASASKTSINFYQTTWRNNPQDSHIHTHRRENLKLRKRLPFYGWRLLFVS